MNKLKIIALAAGFPALMACTQTESRTRAISVDGERYIVLESVEVSEAGFPDSVNSRTVVVSGKYYDCPIGVSCEDVVRRILAAEMAAKEARDAENAARTAEISAAKSAAAQARRARREAEENPEADSRGD